MRHLAAAIALLALAALVGCGEASSASPARAASPQTYPYKVTTTVGMITDIVRQVAGDKAQVNGIIGEGIDPHLYKPTRSDVLALQNADVVFYNGLKLEGKMTDMLESLSGQGKPTFAVTDLVLKQPDYVMNKPGQEHYDPHVWMDPKAWAFAVQSVADSLSSYDPTNRDTYQQNAKAYQEKLKQLDAYTGKVLGSIPADHRVLVTAHDAFNYLGRAYDIQVRGIQGISTESEAGVRDIESLVSFLAENHIPAVFVETSVSDKNVRALLEGVRSKGHQVIIGGSLFSDAMGQAGTYEGTYIGMIDHNVTIISRALGGDAPAGGMNNQLKPE